MLIYKRYEVLSSKHLLLSSVLTSFLILTLFFILTMPTLSAAVGDLNSDDSVDFSDVFIIIKWIFNIDRTNNAADVNSDGEVNIFDIVRVSTLLGKRYGTDNTAPLITGHKPNIGTLPLGTTSIVVGVEVNERANCRYSSSSGQAFASMTLFAKRGGIFNSYNATGLQDNQTYNYYVKCRDEAGNLNSTDYYFNFSVGTAIEGGGGNGEPVCEATIGNCYYVSTSGNDANPGTFAQPFRNILKGLQTVQNGDVLYIRGGTYRLMNEASSYYSLIRSGATPTNYVTIKSYPGETPKILGSINSQGQTWVQYDSNIWRIPADFLSLDPKGMHNAASEERINHVMQFIGGVRNHGNISQLTSPGLWTKADANGIWCGASSNAGCYIYLYPSVGENPTTQTYEFSQRRLLYALGTSYVHISGLTVYYTNPAPWYLESGVGHVIENNTLGHNSNGDDNSYGGGYYLVTGGTIIRGNKVFDSRHWAENSGNSKGITFIYNDPDNPSIIEDNEVYDVVAGISTKGGGSDLIIRRNYLHDIVAEGVITTSPRCISGATNCTASSPDFYPEDRWQIYENIFVNVGVGVHFSIVGGGETKESLLSYNNSVYNNIFYNRATDNAFQISWSQSGNISSGNIIKNNIIFGGYRGIYLNNGAVGTTRTVNDFLPHFTSDYNLFFNSSNTYFLRPNWGGPGGSGTGYNFSQVQGTYSRELNSLNADPQFAEFVNYTLSPSSPAIGAGNATIWNSDIVDIGRWPNPR